MTLSLHCRPTRRGFTLVEIMVAVVIIGVIASLAIPSLNRARQNSQNAAVINDLRTFAAAFETYSMMYGQWPADVSRGVVPAGLAEWLPVHNWTGQSPIGGQYDWDLNVFGVTAAVSVAGHQASSTQIEKLLQTFDDGRPDTGRLRVRNDRILYVLQD